MPKKTDNLDIVIRENSLPKDYINYIFVYAYPQPTPVISLYFVKGSPTKLWERIFFIVNPASRTNLFTSIINDYPNNDAIIKYVNDNEYKLTKGDKYTLNNLVHLHLTRLPFYSPSPEFYFYYKPTTDIDATIKLLKYQYPYLTNKQIITAVNKMNKLADTFTVKKINLVFGNEVEGNKEI